MLRCQFGFVIVHFRHALKEVLSAPSVTSLIMDTKAAKEVSVIVISIFYVYIFLFFNLNVFGLVWCDGCCR